MDPTPTDNELFDLHTLADYGKRGVLLLLSDSTNVDRPGYTESERAVRPRLEDLFNRAERRLVISCFSSSIHRLQQILDLAAEYGRKVAFLGRSMMSITEIAHDLGLAAIFPTTSCCVRRTSCRRRRRRCAWWCPARRASRCRRCRAWRWTITRASAIEPGDTVVLSARIIPGQREGDLPDDQPPGAARRGRRSTASMNPPVHVSGHGSAEELKLILNLVRPKYFVPIHGEYRQLAKHAALAQHLRHSGLEETFVLETGDTLEIDQHGARRGERVTVGRVCIDSGSLDDVVEDIVIRDRRHLSEDGFVLPIIAINKHTGKSEGLPEIVSRGFVSLDDGDGADAGGAPGGGEDARNLHRGGAHRLGRDAGEDPRGPEALPHQADLAPAADHAGDSRGLVCWNNNSSGWSRRAFN